MPLRGEAANKYGGRYEGLWTVSCMADVAAELANSIRLQPPGEEGEGVEFWISGDDTREYHQVKRQRGSAGHWTISALSKQGVLTSFFNKLNDQSSRCCFVSIDGAPELAELTDRARSAASFDEFRTEFLSEDLRESFGRLRDAWGKCSQAEAFDRLQRIYVRTMDEHSLRAYAEVRLESLAEGDPSDVADVLARFALDQVHQELRAFDLWQHLEEKQQRRRDWANDPRAVASVEDAYGRYVNMLRGELVAGTVLARAETQSTLDHLTVAEEKRGVLLVGEAGVASLAASLRKEARGSASNPLVPRSLS